MRVLREFPERFRHLNRDVAEVQLHFPLSEDDLAPEEQAAIEGLVAWGKSYDFCVLMSDGRCFGFSAMTPEAMREYMDREQQLSFVTSGLVVVSEITEEALLESLEQCLKWTSDYPLEHFGFPCSDEAVWDAG